VATQKRNKREEKKLAEGSGALRGGGEGGGGGVRGGHFRGVVRSGPHACDGIEVRR